MCNDYRLLADATTLFADFSETKIKIRFSEGKPNLSRFHLANQRIGFLRLAACADSQGGWHGGKVSDYGKR
jgi:hypothetical protein